MGYPSETNLMSTQLVFIHNCQVRQDAQKCAYDIHIWGLQEHVWHLHQALLRSDTWALLRGAMVTRISLVKP
jgi:hypothetical protein